VLPASAPGERRSITDFRFESHELQNGGNPHNRSGCFETQHKREGRRKSNFERIRPDSPVKSIRSCQLQRSVTVGTLKFT
jgi:hypothetical protein